MQCRRRCPSAGGAPIRRLPLPSAGRQIAAADIVGAAARGCDLTIWYAPMATKPGADKPARRMQQSPALALESPALAEQAAAHLRTACCWHGGRQPPRLLVIVNPASGPGRWAGGGGRLPTGRAAVLLVRQLSITLCLMPPVCGRAPTIYEGEVRPALEAAGYRVQMYQTQAPVHATGAPCCAGAVAVAALAVAALHLHHPAPSPALLMPLLSCLLLAELVKGVAPGSVDAIVAIGGDGTMHETLQARRLG